jgi:hypothetical protein
MARAVPRGAKPKPQLVFYRHVRRLAMRMKTGGSSISPLTFLSGIGIFGTEHFQPSRGGKDQLISAADLEGIKDR